MKGLTKKAVYRRSQSSSKVAKWYSCVGTMLQAINNCATVPTMCAHTNALHPIHGANTTPYAQ